MSSVARSPPVPSNGVTSEQGDSASSGTDAQSASVAPNDPIYYLYGEDVRWWEEEEDKGDTIPATEAWEHPPRPQCLLETIHKLNDTHIPSPFLYTRYPHEYKSEAYTLYHEPESQRKKSDPPKEQSAPKETSEPHRRRVNIELTPVKRPEACAKPRKSLRERLEDGEVVFYEDYVEREIARDYCRLFGHPFSVPRHDWGGGDFFFGEHVPPVVSEPKDAPGQDDDDKLSEKSAESVEAPVKHRQVDALILSDSSLDSAQRQEMLEGKIANLYSALPSGATRQRHPKDRLVSFHHLRTYAYMIDSVTKCPLIHVELQSALKQGWSPERETAKLQPRTRTRQLPHDPYTVTPEQLARANEILASRRKIKADSSKDVKVMVSRRQAAQKETVQVGGGRYEV
ncbi:chromosome segregation protein, putative [Babesia ovata]|uniref:Chromosome segregation protein, putative n=1 Tax=Babesia ovata TaxID=189622 RepID=A0A2H6K8L8_9APIC|nr:chromosome segregation protein, putative [Babesia ovata]GBE59345.1 chromosome segregation protein, putative [Babesia ovata]